MRTGLAFWTSGFPSVVSSFASWIILMSLPDPNAAAPATEQPAGVVASTDEIEKKRIELKSMLTTCFVSSTLQNPGKSGEIKGRGPLKSRIAWRGELTAACKYQHFQSNVFVFKKSPSLEEIKNHEKSLKISIFSPRRP